MAFAGGTQRLHVLLQMIAGSVARYSRIAFAVRKARRGYIIT